MSVSQRTPSCTLRLVPAIARTAPARPVVRPLAFDRVLVTAVALLVLAAAIVIALVTAPFQIASGR